MNSAKKVAASVIGYYVDADWRSKKNQKFIRDLIIELKGYVVEETFHVNDIVEIDTPGEWHHSEAGVVIAAAGNHRYEVRLSDGDVWNYSDNELKATHWTGQDIANIRDRAQRMRDSIKDYIE